MLISLSEVFEIPVSKLLGEEIKESDVDDIQQISEKLEIINLQLAKNKDLKRKTLHIIFITLVIITVTTFILLLFINGRYMSWNNIDFEYSILKSFLHGFEWIFIRVFPAVLIFGILGTYMTRKKF